MTILFLFIKKTRSRKATVYFTVLRFSADPETRYPLVTNFATVSIFKKPFHTISCLAKNCVVSSSVEEFDMTALRDNTQNYMTIIIMHYTVLTLVMIFYSRCFVLCLHSHLNTLKRCHTVWTPLMKTASLR